MKDFESDPVAAALADGEERGYARGAKEERARIRKDLLEEIGAAWETLFTGTSYDAEMVQGIRTITLRLALNRICPGEE